MDPRLQALYFLFDIVLPLAIGYVLRRRGAFDQARLDKLTTLNLFALVPLLNGFAFWRMSLEMALLWLPVLGIVMQVIPGVISLATVTRKYDHAAERGSFILASMLSNRGVVGTIAVYILYAEAGFAWARLVMLLAPLMFFMFCLPLAQFYSLPADERKRPSIASLFLSRNQIPIIGMAVGIALNLLHVPPPAAVTPVFPWLVHAMAWLFLLPVGYAMRFERMREHWRDLFELFGIKFLLTPVLTGAAALAMGLRGDMLATVVILAASPTAIMAVVAGRLTRINLNLALTAFVLTTVVYIVVVFPLLLLIFGYFNVTG